MPVQMKIQDHLIIPFGRPKWHINDIKISAVSTDGTYFESITPCVHIDKAKKEPLRLHKFKDCFPNSFLSIEDSFETLQYMGDFLIEKCELQTNHEKLFLRHYFEHIKNRIEYDNIMEAYPVSASGSAEQDIDKWIDWMFWALMPLPQAHLYVRDPFADYHDTKFYPERMFKVDFAFWTGDRIVAVEIDGSSHIGDTKHVEKDRMLARAGVHVIHILNDEIDKHKDKAVRVLLPQDILYPWSSDYYSKQPEYSNPFNDVFPF